MKGIPDCPPPERWGTRLTNRIAQWLPFGNDRLYLSMWLQVHVSPGGAHRVVPWLCLYNDARNTMQLLVRLPGAKLVEMWDPEHEQWLERFVPADVVEDES